MLKHVIERKSFIGTYRKLAVENFIKNIFRIILCFRDILQEVSGMSLMLAFNFSSHVPHFPSNSFIRDCLSA